VIADQLNELSQGDLKIENPDELIRTNAVLKELGIQNTPRNQKNQRNNNNNRKKQNFKRRK
jgi:hypothetical protein